MDFLIRREEAHDVQFFINFIYFEKATKFCKISTADLSYVVPVKSTVEISQNFVAFSEYMNFDYMFMSLVAGISFE